MFAQAQQESAIFITTDKDFFHTVPLTFEYHWDEIGSRRRMDTMRGGLGDVVLGRGIKKAGTFLFRLLRKDGDDLLSQNL